MYKLVAYIKEYFIKQITNVLFYYPSNRIHPTEFFIPWIYYYNMKTTPKDFFLDYKTEYFHNKLIKYGYRNKFYKAAYKTLISRENVWFHRKELFKNTGPIDMHVNLY